MSNLRVWSITSFTGHYPVGVAAVVVAKDAEDAAKLLTVELSAHGLEQEIKAKSMREVPMVIPMAFILADGNY